MGLDITAYSNLAAIGKHADDCGEDDHIDAFAYDAFPASFRGIPVINLAAGCLDGGCYSITDATLTHGFQAGSYSGYNAWRDNLAQQFNPDGDPNKPFYELIWFADNEGCIGPDAARDLLADFRENEDAYVAPQGWYGRKYVHWMRAFELAADGGLVDFH